MLKDKYMYTMCVKYSNGTHRYTGIFKTKSEAKECFSSALALFSVKDIVSIELHRLKKSKIVDVAFNPNL